MSETYTPVPRFLSEAFADFDVESFDYYLKTGNYATLVRLFDLVSQRFKEGVPINDDHRDVLLRPYQLWGKDYGRVMYEMRVAYWDEMKKPRLTREQKVAERKAKNAGLNVNRSI